MEGVIKLLTSDMKKSHLIRSQPFSHNKLHFLKDFSLEFLFHNVFQRKNGTFYRHRLKNELYKTMIFPKDNDLLKSNRNTLNANDSNCIDVTT